MISIIIPAYNEEKRIGTLLDSLIKQTTKENFEVILVNNNSTDKTVNVAKLYSKKLNLKIVLQKIKGRGAARKKGFETAKGDILFSTDADCIVPKNWLEIFLNTLKESDAVAVTGPIKVTDSSLLINFLINHFYVSLMKFYKMLFGHYWLGGFSFAIYKNVYKKSGGFKEHLNTQEDTELAFRVSKIGKIQLIPNLSVNFAGRRFQNGIIQGFLPYITTFIKYFFLNQRDVKLQDIR